MICATCPNPITARSKSGMCRSCCARKIALSMVGNPEIQAKRTESQKRFLADPEKRAKHVERLKLHHASMTDAEREKRRLWGVHLAETYLTRPDIVARRQAPETRAAIGRKQSERRLAWCPPERRGEYMGLLMNRHFPAAEARRIIEADIPGTVEHARRMIANNLDAARMREERRKAQEY